MQNQAFSNLAIRSGRPNPPLNSDPACIVFRSLSCSRFLDSAHRLGAGGARLASFVRPSGNSPMHNLDSSPSSSTGDLPDKRVRLHTLSKVITIISISLFSLAILIFHVKILPFFNAVYQWHQGNFNPFAKFVLTKGIWASVLLPLTTLLLHQVVKRIKSMNPSSCLLISSSYALLVCCVYLGSLAYFFGYWVLKLPGPAVNHPAHYTLEPII